MTTLNIERITKKLDCNQSQLAKKLGTCNATLTAWKKGRNQPNINIIEEIKSLTGLSYDEITIKI